MHISVGDRKKFRVQRDKWISENVEKTFQFYDYNKYIKALFSDEDAKFIEFEALSSEYCYLDRKFMFSIDEITEEEKSKYFELKNLLFADITIG